MAFLRVRANSLPNNAKNQIYKFSTLTSRKTLRLGYKQIKKGINNSKNELNSIRNQIPSGRLIRFIFLLTFNFVILFLSLANSPSSKQPQQFWEQHRSCSTMKTQSHKWKLLQLSCS